MSLHKAMSGILREDLFMVALQCFALFKVFTPEESLKSDLSFYSGPAEADGKWVCNLHFCL